GLHVQYCLAMGTDAQAPFARCQRCDYPLHGLERAGPCPECGLTFDLADPATFCVGTAMPVLGQWWLATLGWPTMSVLALGNVAWSLYLASPEHLAVIPFVMNLCVPASFLWAPLLVRQVVTQRLIDQRQRVWHRRVRRDFIGVLVNVAVFLALAISVQWAMPTKLWFLPFASRFDVAAETARRTLPVNGVLPPQQIGPWRVQVFKYGDDILIGARIGTTTSADTNGFAHEPMTPRMLTSQMHTVRRMNDSWWAYGFND
ncbi:MAG: hypothetical protein AAGK78_05945, partial [Planctomycetota bacterium]